MVKSAAVFVAGASTYTYNLASQLTAATVNGTSVTYSYDGDGNRLGATTGGMTTSYLWDTNNDLPQLALERDGNGNILRTYLYGNDILGLNEGGSAYYYTHDRLGSITGLTSSSGATEWQYSYEPFGTLRSTTKVDPNAPVNPLNYIGQYQDPTTNLLDLRARQFDETTGRFLGTDPITAPLTDSYSGAYVYGNDDPLRFSDPSGQEGEDHPGWVGPYSEPFDDSPRGDAIRSSEVERDSGVNDGFRDSRIKELGDEDYRRGPSGKPKSHFPRYTTKKEAEQDAARNSPVNDVINDADDRNGPHYHSADENGERLKDPENVHYKYPNARR